MNKKQKKKIAVIFFSIWVLNGLGPTIIPADPQGKCKYNIGSNNWQIRPDSYSECRNRNAKMDKDDLFDKAGDIWWDSQEIGPKPNPPSSDQPTTVNPLIKQVAPAILTND